MGRAVVVVEARHRDVVAYGQVAFVQHGVGGVGDEVAGAGDGLKTGVLVDDLLDLLGAVPAKVAANEHLRRDLKAVRRHLLEVDRLAFVCALAVLGAAHEGNLGVAAFLDQVAHALVHSRCVVLGEAPIPLHLAIYHERASGIKPLYELERLGTVAGHVGRETPDWHDSGVEVQALGNLYGNAQVGLGVGERVIRDQVGENHERVPGLLDCVLHSHAN